MLFLAISVSTDSRSVLERCTFSPIIPFHFFLLSFHVYSRSSSHETYVSCFVLKSLSNIPIHSPCVTFLPPHPLSPRFFPQDPFAPSEGNTNAASSGLDLFGMMTVDNNNPGSSLDACFSSVVPQPSPSPSPSPLFTSASSTITTTATISAPIAPSAASPATDLFSGKH